jgi:hypothetical protein
MFDFPKLAATGIVGFFDQASAGFLTAQWINDNATV